MNRFEKDIKLLEEDIKNTKDENEKKKKKIELLKKIKLLTLFGAPPAVTIGLLTYTMSYVFGETPFIRDDKTEYLKRKTILDSMGNTACEEQYKDFSNNYTTITYVGKWKESKDGYARVIRTYKDNSKNLSKNEIEKIVKNRDELSLEDILGKPIVEYYDSKNNITDEEKNLKAYLVANIYEEDKSKCKVIKETIDENEKSTKAYLIVLLCALSVDAYIGFASGFYDDAKDIKNNAKADKANLDKNLETKISLLNKFKEELEERKAKETNLLDENISKKLH